MKEKDERRKRKMRGIKKERIKEKDEGVQRKKEGGEGYKRKREGKEKEKTKQKLGRH